MICIGYFEYVLTTLYPGHCLIPSAVFDKLIIKLYSSSYFVPSPNETFIHSVKKQVQLHFSCTAVSSGVSSATSDETAVQLKCS